MKSFLLKYALIPLTATMFALWYFSLAMDELRKRFPFLDRIFAFFTGNKRSIQATGHESVPADQPQTPVEPKDDSQATDKPAPVKPAPVELPKPAEPPKPADPPKPAELPKPKPVPAAEPVKPVAPKVDPPKSTISPAPTVPEKTASTTAEKTDKPAAEPAPVKPAEPVKPAPPSPMPTPAVEMPQPKDLPKPEPVPATPAPAPAPAPAKEPLPTPAPARLVKEKKELPSPTPKSAPAPTPAPTTTPASAPAPTPEPETVLPANNEDSFIIVEQQKPAKPAPGKPKVDLKNSTMDFLQSEGGSRGVPPPSSANSVNKEHPKPASGRAGMKKKEKINHVRLRLPEPVTLEAATIPPRS